ncbi:Sensor protein qseC [Serratia odorifera]|uniref:Sensor protein qseC n=1 Tax=Serratia odorifera TaxID=618 RepID=A0A447KSA3_SEROD|nr:Sensor protein qseC [Serratia odorifera]
MKRLSLRLRLIIIFSLLALLTWCIASAVAWNITRHNIDQLFDTQQMLFAKRLATANLGRSVNAAGGAQPAGDQKTGQPRQTR